MDESKLVDWYEVIESVANGRRDGLRCPYCPDSVVVVTEVQALVVRIHCPSCNEGIEGRFARDDAFEATARAKDNGDSKLPAPALPEERDEASAPLGEPWEWQLPSEARGDLEGLSCWADVVEQVCNGKRKGLRCPFCSEPLTDIRHDEPYLRIVCGVCGEAFEGKLY